MSEITEEIRKKLVKNKYVSQVKTKQVEFTAAFKIKAVREYIKGKSPVDYFEESGFKSEWFPKDYFRLCVKRWKKKFDEQGEDSLKVNKTGKHSAGRPRKPATDDLTLEALRAIVEIQRETIEILKKTRALPSQKRS